MREKGSLKNIINLIRSDRRYWIVFTVLVAAVVFGKNIDTEDQCFSSDLKTDVYVIDQNEDSYFVENFLNTDAGDYYRLRLNAKAQGDDAASDLSKQQQVKIDVKLLGLNGQVRKIANIALDQDGKYHPSEILFKTEGKYQHVEFQRKSNERSNIKIDSDIKITRLDVKSDEELASLSPTLSGDLTLTGQYPDMPKENPDVIYSFNRSKRLIAQTFIAEDNIVSEVELKLHFFGNGGVGDYHLSLHNIDGDKIVKEELAQFDFSTDIAENKYKSDPGNEIYRFPLASRVESGKEYALVISSENVRVNLMHNLRVFGFKSKENVNGIAAKVSHGKIGKELGDIYFQVIYPKHGDDNMIFGASLEDVGGGKHQYQYQMLNKPVDLLAIDSHKGSIIFDKSLGAVVGSTENNAEVIYRFNFIDVPAFIYVYLEQIGGGYIDTNFEYSFDEKSWQSIKLIDDTGSLNMFEATLDNNLYREFFLRVSYDRNDVDYKSSKEFGFRSMRVYAETK